MCKIANKTKNFNVNIKLDLRGGVGVKVAFILTKVENQACSFLPQIQMFHFFYLSFLPASRAHLLLVCLFDLHLQT